MINIENLRLKIEDLMSAFGGSIYTPIYAIFQGGLINTGSMSFGVKGLHAGDVDRENRKPKIEGPWLKEGINREK